MMRTSHAEPEQEYVVPALKNAHARAAASPPSPAGRGKASTFRRDPFRIPRSHAWAKAISLGCLALLLAMAMLPLDIHAQGQLAGVGTALLLALYLYALYHERRGQPPDGQPDALPDALPAPAWLRLALIALSLWLGWRYLYWRATETLPFGYGMASSLAGLALFLVELHGFVTFVFGHLINLAPLQRGERLLRADEQAPTVDIFIPTYSEDPQIVRITLIAATQLDYPQDRYRVWILDDGGTRQKLADPDPQRAAAAAQRADSLKQMAKHYGARYLSRERNEHAKAGNLNHALQASAGEPGGGELILVLDCDHIPTRDFLRRTVGQFIDDPRLFLLQSPHNFVNPDPVARNLKLFDIAPAENELFYSVMQPGLDAWGATFFCGSAAVLRRSVLDEIGGIQGQTITEDAETTLEAMALGYRTAYLNRPMVSGLQPETFAGLIVQRSRWAQGMLQIFLLKNPWTLRGLSTMQRLMYTNFSWFWGFAVSRLLLMLAPPAFLLFGLNLCDTSAEALLVYALPYLVASLTLAQLYYRRVRWPLLSQLYETIQSWHLTLAVGRVLLKPRAPTFQVTPKGETLEKKFVSAMATPLYVLLALNIASLFWGGVRLQTEPWHHSAIIFVMSWAVLDGAFLLAALGVTLERPQKRSSPRIPWEQSLILQVGDLRFAAVGEDLSRSGAAIRLSPAEDRRLRAAGLNSMAGQQVRLEFPARGIIDAKIVHVRQRGLAGRHYTRLGLRYCFTDVEQERLAIDLAFGDSEQLIRINRSRHGGKSVPDGILTLVYLAARFGLQHLWLRARGAA